MPMRTMCLILGAILASGHAAGAGDSEDVFSHLEWRNIGPVNMSGRVADVEGIAGNPRVVWVGSASGGVWKTTDGGLTFEPVFDEQPIASIGDIGVARIVRQRGLQDHGWRSDLDPPRPRRHAPHLQGAGPPQ